MATYYGVKGSSNWNSGNWSTTATKDATRTGSAVTPTANDDCILDDWSSDGGGVTWTINATTCLCKSLNCTGYAGALVFTASQKLTSSGSVTFTSSMTCTGAGNLTVSTGTITTGGISVAIGVLTLTGSVTINSNGTTWTNIINSVGAVTITLSSALSCTTMLITSYGNLAFAGAFSITCDNLYIYVSSITITFVAGQTITIVSSLHLISYTPALNSTILSGTASSDIFLHYNGLVSNAVISRFKFTDVNCAHAIDNWYGGTLTRTTGITNRTSADILDISDADLTVAEAPTGKKFYAVSGGVKTGTGTKTLSTANDTVAAGYYEATTLSTVDTDLTGVNIVTGKTIFGVAGSAEAGGGGRPEIRGGNL
jgi:hypothetical protein